VDDTRRRFALRHLADPTITLTEVAYLLGYSEVQRFNRAFKRWTGSTPSDHRHGRRAPLEAICAGGGEARQVVVGVPEGLRASSSAAGRVADLQLSVMPIPPCSCTASWLTCRAASAILICRRRDDTPRSAASAGVDLHARQRRDRAPPARRR